MTIHNKLRKHQRFGVVEIDPPGWVALDRLRCLNDALAERLTKEDREDLMIELFRELSADGKPIGADVMCIRIPAAEPKPVIRFEPERVPARTFTREDDGKSQAMSVAYTPTIIAPGAIQLPSLTTGAPFENLNGFKVEWKLPRLGPPEFDGTLVWMVDRQPRRAGPNDPIKHPTR